MATIRERPQKDGSITYTVLWRAAGKRTGKQESEIFTDPTHAETFRGLVNMQKQNWPPGWVRGQGFVQQEPAKGADMPLTEWAHHVVSKRNGLEGRTRWKYERAIDIHLTRVVHTTARGEMPATVANVTADDISDWIRAMEAGLPDPDRKDRWLVRPQAATTLAGHHGLLSGIFDEALTAEPPLRANNPCAKTNLPRQDTATDEEMCFLEHDEYQRLRFELAKLGDQHAVDLVDLLVGTGLRWHEATALKVKDLKLTGREPTLTVNRGWSRQKGGWYKLGPPKTRKGRRMIGLSPRLVAILRRRVTGLDSDAFVLTTSEGNVWNNSNFRHRKWQPAIKAARAAGLPRSPRIHDLRHTHVAWLIADRIPLPAIQARLGHESIKTTIDRYGHLSRHLDAEIAVAVDAAMAGDNNGELRLVMN